MSPFSLAGLPMPQSKYDVVECVDVIRKSTCVQILKDESQNNQNDNEHNRKISRVHTQNTFTRRAAHLSSISPQLLLLIYTARSS